MMQTGAIELGTAQNRRTFKGTVAGVVDGDTVKLSVKLARIRGKDLDLGFHVYKEQGWLVLHYTFRLLGCNAWEHGTPAGDAATANLRALLPTGTVVGLTSISADKYFRYDAQVTLPDGRDLVSVLVAGQWATPWDGLGTKPLPPWPRSVQ